MARVYKVWRRYILIDPKVGYEYEENRTGITWTGLDTMVYEVF